MSPVAQRARIARLPLSPTHAPLEFEMKLADENGWTLGHARAVTLEYRRFLALTLVPGAQAFPCADVERAWQLHIMRSADYARFCDAAFGRFLHHSATRDTPGGRVERRVRYRATYELYREIVGIAPPSAVWPMPDETGSDGAGARLPPRREALWRLPGAARFRGPRIAMVLAAAACVAMLLVDTNAMVALEALHGPGFLALAIVCQAALVVALRVRPFQPPHDPRATLDVYELACTHGGEPRIAATAIAVQIAQGRVVVDVSSSPTAPHCRVVPGAPAPTHPVERAVLAAAREGELGALDSLRAVAAFTDRTRQRLHAAGLRGDPASVPVRRAIVLGGATALFGLELARFAHAVGTPRPTFFLGLLMVFTSMFLLWCCKAGDLVTASGLAARSRYRALADYEVQARSKALDAASEAERPALAATLKASPLAVAVLGSEAVAHDARFAALGHYWRELSVLAWPAAAQPVDGSGGGSCGGGGGGCGGGCGGGGCGG